MRRGHRRGYVLLLTLLLLAMAASVLSALCLRSFDLAVRSQRASEQLQRRWAARSCQATFGPLAEKILAAAQREDNQPHASVRRKLSLGGQKFEVLIGDEQAKLNVNTLCQSQDLAKAEESLRQLVQEMRQPPVVSLQPRREQPQEVLGQTQQPPGQSPQAGGQKPLPPLPAFGSYEQVFAQVHPGQLVDQDAEPGAAHNVGLWGDGKLNYVRASSEALQVGCDPLLGPQEAQALQAAAATWPPLPLGEALDSLQVSDSGRQRLARLLTDRSSCWSVWVIGEDLQRRWYSLRVFEKQGPGAGLEW